MAYFMYIQTVCFPITPGKMTLKIENKNKTVTLINEGEVNLIKTPGLTDIQIDELILPAIQQYPFANYLNDEFKGPDYYIEKIEAWKKKKNPVQFKLTRTTPDGKNLLWDTNFDVTIEDYEIIEDADNQGMDVKIKLNMKEYRTWGSKKLVKKKNKKKDTSRFSVSVGIGKKVRKTKEVAKTYTVKKGDCLYNIAKKQLNNASRWKEIYTLNKKTIESVAKKHGRKSSSNGHWIYPGTKLKLPSK